jgi:hypothetical protein
VSKVPIIDLDALMGKELHDVVCAAYRMGCDQTREVYQKRIEKLEAALRWIVEQERQTAHPTVCAIVKTARKALEGKDD